MHTESNQLRALGPTVEASHGRVYTALVANPPVHGYSIRDQQQQVRYTDFLHVADFSRRQIAILESQMSGHHEFLKSLGKLPLTRGREYLLQRYPGPFPETPLPRATETLNAKPRGKIKQLS